MIKMLGLQSEWVIKYWHFRLGSSLQLQAKVSVSDDPGKLASVANILGLGLDGELF